MSRKNYFNNLTLAQKLEQLGRCRFMDSSEFNGVEALKGNKIVIVGCGAQGLNQGLNLRDSGLDVSYTLRDSAIAEKRQSWKNATENGFTVGTYEELLPTADLVLNLTPDKQHAAVVAAVQPRTEQTVLGVTWVDALLVFNSVCATLPRKFGPHRRLGHGGWV